jgi:hypothetical protein
VSKKKKRLERMRHNKRNVSYSDYLSILDDFGYTVRMGKGSHRAANVSVGSKKLTLTFVEPKKFMDVAYVDELLSQIDDIETWLEELEQKDDASE